MVGVLYVMLFLRAGVQAQHSNVAYLARYLFFRFCAIVRPNIVNALVKSCPRKLWSFSFRPALYSFCSWFIDAIGLMDESICELQNCSVIELESVEL